MSIELTANDNYNSSESNFIRVPLKWYYSLLDSKQKRPDYRIITGMAVLGDLYLNAADKDGYIDGEFNLDGKNTGGILLDKKIIETLDQHYDNEASHLVCMNLVNFISDTKNEFGYLASYLLSFLVLEHADEITDSPQNSCLVDKKALLEFFNETPQRVRKALELLRKLNLIIFKVCADHFEISLNTKIVSSLKKGDEE